MNTIADTEWLRYNQDFLGRELARLRETLELYLGDEERVAEKQASVTEHESMSALEILAERFRLSPFERGVLLLCAGVELDASFAALCARVSGSGAPSRITFALTLAVLPDAHWSALAPDEPLRGFRLVEMEGEGPLTRRELRINERVLHFLLGLSVGESELRGMVEDLDAFADRAMENPPRVHLETARNLARYWNEKPERAVRIYGERDRRFVFALAAQELKLEPRVVSADLLPARREELLDFARLWEREAILEGLALYLELEPDAAAEMERRALVFLRILRSPRALATRDLTAADDMPALRTGRPGSDEQREIWRAVLGDERAESETAELAGRFDFGVEQIVRAGREALIPANGNASHHAHLPGACFAEVEANMGALARRVEPRATWNELVLSSEKIRTLKEIALHVRHRRRVHDAWGFAERGERGLGLSALFAGPSGTGKTMAAEVLANELGLELYMIDLSAVVSKYIGETEKNLRRVFDAAESGGAILLFDEADALFGKRTEVRDSHDRYANIEVSYLLQRMEAYRGLSILTTNLKTSMDEAFMRRIRFVVQFPFPDTARRTEIWRRVFPERMPRGDLDLERLARLNVAGGNIRNIALNAAFIAADVGDAVHMEHVMHAARGEYIKLEKSINEAEFGEKNQH